MGILKRNQSNDVLFLMPVRLGNEKTPKSKVRMLYCDTTGKVYAPLMNKSVYELARDNIQRMEQQHKSFATVGLEVSPGKYLPTVVEIGPEETWALEHILEHAIKKGIIPDILKRYLKPIIVTGRANREAVISEHKKLRQKTSPETPPKVLDRLPYYPEHDIEFSMPIYKAEYSYPLIVLKRIAPDNKNLKSPQNLLVLDSAGDMAVIKVPYRLIENMEKGLKAQERKNKRNMCATISQQMTGMAVDYILISQAQRKALDTITRYFEETGKGKQRISAAAREVLSRARNKVSFPAA